MHVEEYGAIPRHFLPGAGEILHEVVLLVESGLSMVTRGRVLDAPHGTTALVGDVLVCAEFVPREEGSDAEIVETPAGMQHRRIGYLVPSRFLGTGVLGLDVPLGIDAVAAVGEDGEEMACAEAERLAGRETPAIIAGPVMQ